MQQTGNLMCDTSSENPDLSKNSFGFMRNIHGSAAYWQRAKLDPFAMFHTAKQKKVKITNQLLVQLQGFNN